MRELELKRVTFTFEDDSQKVIEGDELVKWQAICLSYSDYLLPGKPSHVLGTLFGGITRGFVPPEIAEYTQRKEGLK